MADNSTGLPVKIVDSAGVNLAAVDASGRVSTNIGSYGGTASTLGQKVMASSIPVTLASDQSALSVTLAANQSINLVQWNGVSVTAAAALADTVTNPTTGIVADVPLLFNGTTYDRARSIAASDGNAALTTTGILASGVGPGFSRRFNPANLATAAASASAVDVNGAGTLGIEIGTATTGTFVIEVTADGTTWVPGLAYDVAGALFVTNTSLTPAVGKVYVVSVNGMRQARLRTNATLGATVAHTLTLSMGDTINLSPSGGVAGAVNLTQVGGASIAIGQAAMAASLPVVIASNQSNVPTNTVQYGGTNVVTGGVAGSVGTGGLAASGATLAGSPVLIGGTFTTAQPTITTGQVVNLQSTARGALIVASGVDAINVTLAANQSINIVQYGGVALGPTAFGPARLTDGTAYYTKTGQTAGTAAFAQLSDQTNTASIIAAINALKTDMSSIIGAVPGATNALPVRLTDGAAFYSSASAAPSAPVFSTTTSAALGAGASVTVNHFVTSGKTGQLAGFDLTSTVPFKAIINTVLTGTPTGRVVLFAQPYTPLMWRSPYITYITRASADASSGFSVTFKNMDSAVAADVYSTGYWNEV